MSNALNSTADCMTAAPSAHASHAKATAVSVISGDIVSTIAHGRAVRFFVADRDDVIQGGSHAQGVFYEPEELEIIAGHFPPGGVFVDIGANVGNHTLFVGKYLRPRQVIVIEANPPAIEVLQVNIELNGLQTLVDASHLGVGLSDSASSATPDTPPGNLGATRLLPCGGGIGSIPLIPGDAILRDRRVDFLKVDVEAMELRVLAGLEETLARWRPAIFIEVDDLNVEPFRDWMRSRGYVSVCRYRRYPVNENYMLLPVETVGSATRLSPVPV
jgi:FkbM family methyltransferase